MSYGPNQMYPGATELDPDYPKDKFKDNNPSTTNNGTPLKAIKENQDLTLETAVMNDAGFEYNGLPDTPQDSQLFKAYKASLGNGANLLSNHNFLTQTPDDSQPLPSATPTSYPPGYQIFSGVFANESTGITNLTYIDGRVSFSGGDLYFAVPNSGAIARLTAAQLTASVADFDGKPRTLGVSFSLVGNEYRVTVGVDALEDAGAALTPLGSVKFEQGSVATGHEVGEALDVSALQVQPLNNFWNIYLRPEMIKTGATVAFPPATGPGITIPAGSQFAYGYFADTELTGVWIDETGGMRWAAGTVRQEVPFDGSDDRLASDISASFYDQARIQHYLSGAVTKGASAWEVRITPTDLSGVGATSMRALLPAGAVGGVDWLSGDEAERMIRGFNLISDAQTTIHIFGDGSFAGDAQVSAFLDSAGSGVETIVLPIIASSLRVVGSSPQSTSVGGGYAQGVTCSAFIANPSQITVRIKGIDFLANSTQPASVTFKGQL